MSDWNRQGKGPTLSDIAKKLDRLAQDDVRVFTADEVKEILSAVECVKTFHGDTAALRRLVDAFIAFEGAVKVSKAFAVLIVAVVAVWTQWDRLTDLLFARGAGP